MPALRKLGVDLPILDCDSDAASPGSNGAFEALLAKERGHALRFDVQGDDNAIAALYHTGGTTGAPKLVQHTRRNEAHVARSCALLHALGPGDVVLNGFPLFHVAGAFVLGLSALSAGSTVLIPGRLGMRNQKFVNTFWQQAQRLRTTVIGAVPTILSGLLGIPLDADISEIRVALTGGAPLPTELAANFEKQTGIPVRNIFGMTESAGGIAMEPVHAARTPLCCGLPLPFTEVVILEHDGEIPDLSRTCRTGATGVVAVRGPNISPGYTDRSLNEGIFLDGGWLLTGDLGRLDDEGRVYLTGRAKDVIIRGSHNIDPQSIEDALMAHPDVESAAAVGMPDSYSGELPVVFIMLRPGASASQKDLLAFLETRIEEPAAMPRRAEIIEQMPLTPIGKIFKPALRARAIRWAIDAAAKTAGTPEGSYSIEVNDKLEVAVAVDADKLQALRDAIVGMPITITFTT